MAYYTKLQVVDFIKEVLERGKRNEIKIMVDPEEAASKIGSDEDIVAMFWVETNKVENSENLKIGLDGKMFVRIDFDLYCDDRYAIDCYNACIESTTVSNVVRKRNEEIEKNKNSITQSEAEKIK